MQLGIFAQTFRRPRFGDALDAVAAHGLRGIQFNFTCVGLPSLPERIDSQVISTIRLECAGGAGKRPPVEIVGVSGEFNLIDPDAHTRRERLVRLPVLAKATRELGCEIITLCSGSRDPEDMRRAHAENVSPSAWRDLLRSMEESIAVAEQHGILLAVEPEAGTIVNSARKARQLLDELHSSRVKIVLDPANLLQRGEMERIRETMEEAFQLLGTDIVIAHARELSADAGSAAPGEGVLDWNYYFDTLAQMDFRGAMVMHGLAENQVAGAARFLRSKLWE